MMKTTGRVTWSCAALLLTLTSVSAVQRLNSIDGLKKIGFGQSVPTHSLVLLFWFANKVYMGYNNVIRLTFNPNNGDYGSHYYHNSEYLLDEPPQGQEYYTVGNLYQETSVPLPDYVINPPTLFEEGNRDRIIIRVRGRRIHQVYITQHFDHQGTPYDPDHTYQITPNLLRQIRQFSLRGHFQMLGELRNRYASNADLSEIGNQWGHLVFLGLFLYIVTTPCYYNEESRRPVNRQSTENRGSATYHTSAPQNDDLCLWCRRLIGVLIIVIILLIAFSGKLARV
uniref:uncharacterized protein n=1 Tax=Semicossyphus pulcher TaxID=241346 RepID=UPI0037E835C7